jgi:hypothetical protein
MSTLPLQSHQPVIPLVLGEPPAAGLPPPSRSRPRPPPASRPPLNPHAMVTLPNGHLCFPPALLAGLAPPSPTRRLQQKRTTAEERRSWTMWSANTWCRVSKNKHSVYICVLLLLCYYYYMRVRYTNMPKVDNHTKKSPKEKQLSHMCMFHVHYMSCTYILLGCPHFIFYFIIFSARFETHALDSRQLGAQKFVITKWHQTSENKLRYGCTGHYLLLQTLFVLIYSYIYLLPIPCVFSRPYDVHCIY